MVGYIFLWAICGVVAAIIASGKGLGAGLWFVIGLLLGPFGVLCSLFVSKNNEKLQNQALAVGELKKCQFCAELIKGEANICRFCNREQEELQEAVHKTMGSIHKKLQDAISNSDVLLVKQLLDDGLDLSTNDQAFEHLEYAKLHKNEEIISLLENASSH
ncbi:hypothetical protein PALB_1310 [Pseudoalteromonas luteoviolacea B = ATCC 29581]|nr:hypothetical protein PALB_1310 [Pseudoalteromonas luteoviolacea B = ATCC 29581]